MLFRIDFKLILFSEFQYIPKLLLLGLVYENQEECLKNTPEGKGECKIVTAKCTMYNLMQIKTQYIIFRLQNKKITLCLIEKFFLNVKCKNPFPCLVLFSIF